MPHCFVSALGDHPRMRGEHSRTTLAGAMYRGSSPHARGALSSFASLFFNARIIPACAGSTTYPRHKGARTGDRPRMRGEHVGVLLQVFDYLGSSPHARGAPLRGFAARGRSGIIPACAGSTPATACRPSRSRNHPRMRGEHGLRHERRRLAGGSSPHARGAPGRRRGQGRIPGIIPACAGSTDVFAKIGKRRRDHPRMRGEHALALLAAGLVLGSSPHARGARYVASHGRLAQGIIPACAGSTRHRGKCFRHSWDHPRMRGEHQR